MDQMASAVGGLIHIDFKDPQVPTVKKVPSDFQAYQYSLCIVDTKASHANLTDDYAKIPEEMQKVAAFFKKKVLREVDEEEFFQEIPGLRSILGTVRYFALFISLRKKREWRSRWKLWKRETSRDFLNW